jgi:flagellar motility protein MotE (MotC chaperone)
MSARSCMQIAAMAAMAALSVAFTSHAHAESSNADEDQNEIREIIEEYCVAVSDIAMEQRMATQSALLKALEAKVENGIARLEQRKSELEALLKRRDDLRNLAQKELVEIYSGMDPEAASLQLEKLDVRLASSVLRQLKPRQASAVLNEMNPEFAARMAKLIAIAAQSEKSGQ